MKKVLLLVITILSGFLVKQNIQERAYEMQAEAAVVAVHKIKNTKKGDKPFIYKVVVHFESEFGRQYQTSFTSRRLPAYNKGETITLNYNINNPLLVNISKKRILLNPPL